MRQWSFIKDMNHDGLFTISDMWQWIVSVYYYPGDLLILLFSQNKSSTAFFELTSQSYGGLWAGFFSMIIWILIASGIAQVLD